MVTITKIRDEVTPSIESIIRSLGSSGRNQVLRAGGREFLREVKANFIAGGGPYRGNAWPAKKDGSPASLKKTGELMNSIKLGSPRNNFIDIYTRNPYAAAQAFGNKARNLPARNFFPDRKVGSPNYGKQVWSSQRDLYTVITRQLTLQSAGSLPRQSTAIPRAQITYGNPFSPASSPSIK